MIVIECDQGSEAWHNARTGRITASMFAVARDKYKTGPQKGQHKDRVIAGEFDDAGEIHAGFPLGWTAYQRLA